MMRTRYKYRDEAEATDARRRRNLSWHKPYCASSMPWRVFTEAEGVVAVFKHERDARGFAKARYGDSATVEPRKRGWKVGWETDHPQGKESAA